MKSNVLVLVSVVLASCTRGLAAGEPGLDKNVAPHNEGVSPGAHNPVGPAFQPVKRQAGKPVPQQAVPPGEVRRQGDPSLLSEPQAPARGLPTLVGQWDGPYAWPVEAIHAFLLPTGKVLHFAFPGEIQFPSAYVWDPVTGEFTAVPVNRPLFCSGHSFMADGRLLVTGGNGPAPKGEFRGIKDTHIFNPFDETWTRVEDMADGRWYPTNVTLADGNVLTFSGLDELTGAVNSDIELYEPGSGLGWQIVANQALPLYPRMHLLSTGDVFYAGPSWWTGVFGVDTWSWYDEVPNNYGGRYEGISVQLPGQQDAVMIIGGQSGGVVTATAEIIDLGDTLPAWRYTLQPMNYARMHADAVILPDGKILVVGGHSEQHDEGGGGPPASTVYEAEMYDPATETWSLMAAMQNPRVYHSTAVLLPDARVLAAGSLGQFNAEIYSPPYLFGGPRPVIAAAPAQAPYGDFFEIQTPDAADIESVVLIRLASVTHSVNMDQRHVRLDFVQSPGSPGILLADAPSNPALAPPGYYMLFLLNADGVPSTAKMIRLSEATEVIPTVSEWGAVVMGLLLLGAGTIVIRRRCELSARQL
ncbi:MAG: IPTL-CTERM sorting domain-containing protein [Phycisphaerae bacterium]